MTKLMKRQNTFLSNDEKQMINLFYSVNQDAEKKKQVNEHSEFLESLVVLKTSSSNLSLFEKLVRIHNKVGIKYAKKYLNGFLEYKGVSNINEYLKISN